MALCRSSHSPTASLSSRPVDHAGVLQNAVEHLAAQPIHQLFDVGSQPADFGPADVAGRAGDVRSDSRAEAVDLTAADALAGVMVPQVEPRLPVPQRGHPVLQGVSGARMILPRVGRINQSKSARPALGVGGCRLILTAGYFPFIRRLWRTRSCCLNRLPPPALPCCIR